MGGLNVLRFWHPVIQSAALRDGPALATVAGRRIALFRDQRGRAAALDDLCPHRNASLAEAGSVREGRIVCGYHGWSFDAQGCGTSPSQPNLKSCNALNLAVQEKWGTVWIAEAGVAESALPKLGWDAEGFVHAGSFDVPFDAPLETVLDNFSEDEHFPNVHAMLGWDAAGLPQVEFTADNFDDRTEVRYAGPQRRHFMLPIFGVRAGDRYFNEWVTRFDPVHAVFAFRWEDPKTSAPRPLSVRTAIFLVPEAERRTRLHAILFARAAPGSIFGSMLPIVRRAAIWMGKREVHADARICAKVHTPASLDGLRLGRFDKPVIHNRKLLRSVYYGEAGPRLSIVEKA